MHGVQTVRDMAAQQWPAGYNVGKAVRAGDWGKALEMLLAGLAESDAPSAQPNTESSPPCSRQPGSRPQHEILQRVSDAGYVGGQEDMIVDIALQFAAERERVGRSTHARKSRHERLRVLAPIVRHHTGLSALTATAAQTVAIAAAGWS